MTSTALTLSFSGAGRFETNAHGVQADHDFRIAVVQPGTVQFISRPTNNNGSFATSVNIVGSNNHFISNYHNVSIINNVVYRNGVRVDSAQESEQYTYQRELSWAQILQAFTAGAATMNYASALHLDVSGGVTLTCNHRLPTLSQLVLHCSGSSRLFLQGVPLAVDYLEVHASGASAIEVTRNLVAARVVAQASGASSIRTVSFLRDAQFEASGASSIRHHYAGQGVPNVRQQVSGAASITHGV